jgi:hypothetical protein
VKSPGFHIPDGISVVTIKGNKKERVRGPKEGVHTHLNASRYLPVHDMQSEMMHALLILLVPAIKALAQPRSVDR